MSTYTAISLPEIQEVLREDKGWKIDSTGNEIVFKFALTTRPYINVVVCSSLRKDNQDCRAVGKDAIRVYAVNVIRNRGWITTHRVYRVEGWRKNLQKTVMEVFTQAQNRK